MSTVATSPLHIESVGTGAPIVLLHGWGLHGGLFAPLLPALSAFHRVHAVDLPGHGHAGPLRPWTIAGCVAALEEAFASSQQPLVVLGWSLGGLVAMEWALRHPTRIARLLLVSATPKFVADASWHCATSAQTLDRFADELRVAYRPTLQRFLALQVRDGEAGKATLALMRQRLFERGEPDAAALAQALAVLRTHDLRAWVPALRPPALVIAGDRDTLVPPAASHWLARSLPHAELCEIAGAAHAPFLSHREQFERAVDAFLHRA